MWRTANATDEEQIVAMCEKLYQEDPSPHSVSSEQTKRTLAKLRSEKIRGKAVVLEIDNKITGYALLISFWSNELGGEICYIDELYVRSDYRGNGYASALVKSLIQGDPLWPHPAVAVELEVTPQNTKAKTLYSRLGFSPAKNTKMRFVIK